MENTLLSIIRGNLDVHAIYEEIEDRIIQEIDYELIADNILENFDIQDLITLAAAELLTSYQLPY